MKRYWVAILLVCVLAGLTLYRAIPDSYIEPAETDIGEIQLQSSALASQKESSNVGSSMHELQTTTVFTSEILVNKPVETTPPITTATQPPTPEPTTTVPSATQPATTKPTQATTSPTGSVGPDHTHDYTKEYVSPSGGGQAYYVYTCSCGDRYQENYSCGVEGHICFDEGAHNTLMKYIKEGCTHCGSSECPCLLSISAYGDTWPDYSKCPQYDAHKDPTVYCQDCGLILSNHAKSGQECCRMALKDKECAWCQTMRTAGECHRCTKP